MHYNTLDQVPSDLKMFMANLSTRLGKDYTDEQRLLMANFGDSSICFADAGTGKTETAVGGIAVANLYHQIPADKITVMSFTRQATTELKVRYETACKKLGMRNKISFRTLDSMCKEVIEQNYEELGMDACKTKDTLSVESQAEFILEYSAENGISINPKRVRTVVHAIRSLNSGLIFDRKHVESKIAFHRTKMTYEDFTKLRAGVYSLSKVLDQVSVGDIPLYTLEILLRAPEVSKQLKAKNGLMVIDEFQDMSLLKLRLISLMCDKLVVIGDMKQQIYGFNGASSKIIEHYKEYYPDHFETFLTQSFRCDHKIAQYAKECIAPNKMHEENFKGVERSGKVEHHTEPFNHKEFAKKIGEEYRANNNVFPKTVMFLFRNNQSAIPIIESMYQERIPVQVNKYTPAHQIPVIEDLVALVELVRKPQDPTLLWILNKIVPEFQHYSKVEDNPIYRIMRKEGLDFFEVNFNYRDGYQGELLKTYLLKAKELYAQGEKASTIMNAVYVPYNELYLKRRGMYLENEPEYYMRLVAPMLKEKGFQQFLTDEMNKVRFLKEWSDRHEGVRCYTFHASKGTEADIVHILDADEGIVPNTKKIQDVIDIGAHMDAAREIRNERCLVFVANTRAKEELHIYSQGTLSALFTTNNPYAGLDAIYESTEETFEDIKAFEEFYQM